MSTKNTILDVLYESADKTPETIIYRFLQSESQQDVLTYEMLLKNVRRLAGHLGSLTAASECALILLPSGTPYLVSLLACFNQGVIAVPAYPPRPNLSMTRLLSIIEDCKPTIILSTSDILSKMKSDFPLEHPLHQITQIAVDVALTIPKEPNARAILATDIAFLQYTSGSTSTPKGICVTHTNLLTNLEMLYQVMQLGPNDIHVSWLPLFHDMGLIAGVLLGLYAHNPVIFMSPSDFVRYPMKWLQAISTWKATVSGGPNFAYDLCCQRIKDEALTGIDLSGWRVAYNAAEPIRIETLEKFKQKFSVCGFNRKSFLPAYGMAETTLIVSGSMEEETQVLYADRFKLAQDIVVPVSNDAENAIAVVQCGHTRWADQIVKIVEPISSKERPAFEVGEIWVKGSHVTHGIYKNPNATQELYEGETAEGDKFFLKTGDLGFFDEHANLYITGRLKDLLIINGQNYYPNDIEKIAEHSHPDLVLNGSGAFMTSTNAGIGIAVEVSRNAQALDDAGFQEIVKNIIHHVSQEAQVSLSECVLLKNRALPKTSSGKVQRQKVRAMLLNNELEVLWRYQVDLEPEQQMHFDLPICENLETKISAYCRYWISVRIKCRPDEISLDQSLLSFGLDSLNIMDLLSGIDSHA